MCKIIELNSGRKPEGRYEDDITMTFEEIYREADAIDEEFAAHPERFTEAQRSLIECANSLSDFGDTEFEEARKAKYLEDTLKKALPEMWLPGPDENISWGDNNTTV